MPGPPRLAWAVLGAIVVAGVFLAHRAGTAEEARLQVRLQGVAPTYALELQLAGHAGLGLETAPDDSLYLALIERQKRWLAVSPLVNDIYTVRRGTGAEDLLLVDQREREARTAIGEAFATEAEIQRAFMGTPTFNPAPVTDRWGTWVSAYVPMYDSDRPLVGGAPGPRGVGTPGTGRGPVPGGRGDYLFAFPPPPAIEARDQ